MKKLSNSAETEKSKPEPTPAPADKPQEAPAASPSGNEKSSSGKPDDKPSKSHPPIPVDDTRRVDWIACYLTGINTICNDEDGRCEVEVEWCDDDSQSQASGLERGHGKTMMQAFRQAVDKGIQRCGW